MSDTIGINNPSDVTDFSGLYKIASNGYTMYARMNIDNYMREVISKFLKSLNKDISVHGNLLIRIIQIDKSNNTKDTKVKMFNETRLNLYHEYNDYWNTIKSQGNCINE